MALIVPAPAFTYCTTNITGTPSNSGATGTSITSGTSNAAGTTVAAISAITHDVELLQISITSSFTAATANRLLVDVFTDPAGGTTWGSAPLIPNLLGGGASNISATQVGPHRYDFPIWIASGSSIGVRARYSHTVAVSPRIRVRAHGGHTRPSQWWCGQVVSDIGTSTAASSGTSHTAGNSGAYSSWTNFGSTTSLKSNYVAWAVQTQLSTHNALGYFFEFGAGSNIIGPPIYAGTTTSEQIAILENSQTFAAIPAGTQLQVRATCSGTAQALDVAAYIVS